MARYLAPADPFEEFETGCIRVYYPDSPFLFRALRAQITELESRFLWDTGGDIQAAEKLEQDWLSAGRLTFAAIGQGCQDSGDCEQTIIDLTIQIEQLQQQIEEYENMNITVNCNCGGCGGDCVSYPVPTTPTGEPYPCIPLNPEDPFGDNIPVWDDENEVPPPGWDDYPTFDASRCRSANWFVDSFLVIVRESDLVERQLSVGSVVADIVLILIKFLPGPVGEWAGTAVLIKWITRIVAILAASVGYLEELNDYLQLAADKIEQNKFQLICAAYRMTSVEYLVAFFTTFFGGYIAPELVAAGASTQLVNWTRDIVTPLAEFLAARVHDAFANQSIPEDYVPSYDCANCGNVAPEGFAYIPAELTALAGFVGSGASNPTTSVISNQESQFEMDATAGGRTGRADHEFLARIGLLAGEEWVGFGFTPNAVANINVNNFGAGHPTDTANEFININLTANMVEDVPVQLVLTDKGYPATIEGYRVIQLDELVFAANRVKIGLTLQSATPGHVVGQFSGFYWIKKLSNQ